PHVLRLVWPRVFSRVSLRQRHPAKARAQTRNRCEVGRIREFAIMKVLSRLIVSALGTSLSFAAAAQQPPSVGPYTDFKGTINLDVRDSKADWGPFTPRKA